MQYMPDLPYSLTGAIGESIDQYATRLRSPEEDDPLRFFSYNGAYYTIDNRRLYIYQQAGVEFPIRVREVSASMPLQIPTLTLLLPPTLT